MVQIIPATIADLEQLLDLEDELFTADRISRRQFRYLLTRANAIAAKILQDGTPVGYILLLRRRNSRNLRIYSIGISARAQRRGYGQALLRFAETAAADNGCRYLTLEVCEHNSSAIKLYTAAGFSRHGLKPGYYEDGCTALLLRKEIASEDTPR